MSATQSECLSFRRLPLLPVLVLVLALCTPAWLHAEDGRSSDGTEGECGELGTFEFKPSDWIGHPEPPPGPVTWWVDTDGVDPGKAGCHVGLTSKDGEPNGRGFGEACLPDGMLVETNPAAELRHSHKNDVGHPDKFDCTKWCACQGFAKGACKVVPSEDPLCKGHESAICACSN